MIFHDFWGNEPIARALERAIAANRIPQTLLFAGPAGVGKATLARRVGQALLPHPERIENDDLSRPENTATIAGREKWPAEKRNEDPLLFASHPDFVTFAPDGPLRQISIPQMRTLKERAQFLPHQGNRRVFLIDGIDRAGEQAANALLKILEEPPPYLILIATAENAWDLLPTIRSRSVIFPFSPLSESDMRAFADFRGLDNAEKRLALAQGSPGLALTIDLEAYQKRRAAMVLMLEVAAGMKPFGVWIPVSETIGRSKSEKLEIYLKLIYDLLRDLLLLQNGTPERMRNRDLLRELTPLAQAFPAERIVKAVPKVDALVDLVRRNIQKVIALDGLVMDLQLASVTAAKSS